MIATERDKAIEIRAIALTPERYQQLKEVFQTVRERDAGQREIDRVQVPR